jgi:aminotransferase
MISKRVRDVPPSGIRRFFDLAASEPDIISLGIGEPDFDSPESVKTEAIESINQNLTHYTSNAGLLELRDRISRKLKDENCINVTAEEVLVTSGSSEALDLALRAILDPGQEVLLPDPAYVAYGPLTQLAGGKPVFVPTYEKNDFRVRVEDLENYLTDKTKAILYCSPSNPTGSVLTKKDLEEIADFAIKNDLIVISDEIYERLIYEGKPCSIASIPGMEERTITLNGFSKAYASTGWRVGYAAAKGALMEAMYKIHQYCMLSAPTISQYAMTAAFDSEDSVREMVKIYDERRKLLWKGLNEIKGIECHLPKGAFYAFPNIKGTGLTSEQFTEKVIKEAKVAVVPGNVFGPCGEGFVRCSYSVSTDQIGKALERLDSLFS